MKPLLSAMVSIPALGALTAKPLAVLGVIAPYAATSNHAAARTLDQPAGLMC